jgi:hypothetical protein
MGLLMKSDSDFANQYEKDIYYLEEENKKLKAQLENPPTFESLVENFKIDYNKTSIEGQVVLNQNILGLFITPFSNMLKDSPNYTEITCGLREAGQPELVVTLQKKNGKTPHTLRKEAEAKVKKLERELWQQKFNNEHNLSIDQQVADELKRLREENENLRRGTSNSTSSHSSAGT